MQTVRVRADPDAARDLAVALDGRAVGRERGEARLLGWRGGVETEGFLEDVVEEGKGVDGARGGETPSRVCVGSVVRCRVERRRAEGEEFAAETVLQVGALGEFVHEVCEGDAGSFVPGHQVVQHFRSRGHHGGFQAGGVRLGGFSERLGQASVDHRLCF